VYSLALMHAAHLQLYVLPRSSVGFGSGRSVSGSGVMSFWFVYRL